MAYEIKTLRATTTVPASPILSTPTLSSSILSAHAFLMELFFNTNSQLFSLIENNINLSFNTGKKNVQNFLSLAVLEMITLDKVGVDKMGVDKIGSRQNGE